MSPAVRPLTRRRFLASCATLLALLLAAQLGACRSEPKAPAGPIHLVILHTNDVHGQVLPLATPREGSVAEIGGLSRAAAYIRGVRASDENVIVVDAGDWFQGTPEGTLDGGLPIVRALASSGYDAVCIGNHDFDGGVEHLRALIDTAELPTVLANVREQDGKRLGWTAPWRIVERAGVRIALVGLLTTATPEITHPDARELVFGSPADELARARTELGRESDLIVPVAHLGLEEARTLARSSPELALIVSGHSHDELPDGVREGETLIVQAGSRAAAVGRVDLWFDPATHEVLEARASLQRLEGAAEPEFRVAAVEAACSDLLSRASHELDETLGTLNAPAPRRRELGSSIAGNWICDAMLRRAGAEVALHNKGGIRSDLSSGPLSRRDMFEFLPFENSLVSMDLRGDELEACVRRAIEGTAHKGLDYAGVRVFVHKDEGGAVRLVRIEVAGRPLEPERDYRVVTSTFLAHGGDGLVELQRGRERREDPILLRDLMAIELERAGGATPPADARVIVEEAPVAASKQ